MIGLIMGRVFCVRNEPRLMKQMLRLTSLLLLDKYNKKEFAALYEVGKGSRLYLSLREKYKIRSVSAPGTEAQRSDIEAFTREVQVIRQIQRGCRSV